MEREGEERGERERGLRGGKREGDRKRETERERGGGGANETDTQS